MPIKKFNQTRTYVDLPPKLFNQIEQVADKVKLPRTTLLRRLVIHSFTKHLDAVLRTGEPTIWEEPNILTDKDTDNAG